MDASPMTDLHLADFLLVPLSVGFGAGALIGSSYFLTLRWNVRMLVLGRRPLLAMGLQLARFTLLAGALFLIVRGFGAVSLIAMTGGVLASRTAVLRMGAPA
jgi:F1F0 ATPase subunit 2